MNSKEREQGLHKSAAECTTLEELNKLLKDNEKHKAELKNVFSKVKGSFLNDLIRNSSLSNINDFLNAFREIDPKRTRQILLNFEKNFWRELLERSKEGVYRFFDLIVYKLCAFRLFEELFDSYLLRAKATDFYDVIKYYDLVYFIKKIDPMYKIELDLELMVKMTKKSTIHEIDMAVSTAAEIDKGLLKQVVAVLSLKRILEKEGCNIEAIARILEHTADADKNIFIKAVGENKNRLRHMAEESIKSHAWGKFTPLLEVIRGNYHQMFGFFLENIKKDFGTGKIHPTQEAALLLFLLENHVGESKEFLVLFFKGKLIRNDYFDYEKYSSKKDASAKLNYLGRRLRNIWERWPCLPIARFFSYFARKQLILISRKFPHDHHLTIPEFPDPILEKDFYDAFEKMDRSNDNYYRFELQKHSLKDREIIMFEIQAYHKQEMMEMFSSQVTSNKIEEEFKEKFDTCMKEYKQAENSKDEIGNKMLLLADMLTMTYSERYAENTHNHYLFSEIRNLSKVLKPQTKR